MSTDDERPDLPAVPRTRAELLERPDPPSRAPRSQPADDVRSPGAEDGPPAVVPADDATTVAAG